MSQYCVAVVSICLFCTEFSVIQDSLESMHRLWSQAQRDFLGSLSISFIFQCYVLHTITLFPEMDRTVLSHKQWLGESRQAENKATYEAFRWSTTREHILNTFPRIRRQRTSPLCTCKASGTASFSIIMTVLDTRTQCLQSAPE